MPRLSPTASVNFRGEGVHGGGVFHFIGRTYVTSLALMMTTQPDVRPRRQTNKQVRQQDTIPAIRGGQISDLGDSVGAPPPKGEKTHPGHTM